MSVVEELSGDGSRIVTSWKRTTVADGDWLQHNTISPLNERDVFLAEKIDELSGNADDRLEEEIEARKNADAFLSGTIDTFSGDYKAFKSDTEGNIDYLSGSIDGLSGGLDTEKEERSRKDYSLQSQIDTIKAASDVIMVYGDYHTFTANSGDLILTDADVIKVLVDESTNDKQVYYQWYDPKLEHEWSGWSGIGSLDPYYSKAEIDNLEEQLSATIANTYLSANGTDISAGKNLDVVIQSNNPRVAFKTKDNVTFDGVSSTTLSATTAYGSSAKFTNLSSTNLTSNNISSTKTTATTAYITNLSGASKSDTVDNLFSSAYSGAYASAWINDNKNKIAYTADFKGTNGVVTGYGSSAFAGGISSISAKNGNLTALFTGYNVNLQAGAGVGFNYGTNLLTISAEGKTYAAGDYISITGDTNKINVTGTLINSAQSGQSAYNWITGQSATLSAGSGINFNSAAQNTLGISVKYTTTNGYVTELDGIPLSAGANYTPGRCITIDDQNKINLSSDINLNEKLVIDHYNSSDRDTYTSAILECFQLKFNGASDNGQTTYHNSAIYDIFGVKLYDANASKHILMNNENGLCISSYQGDLSSYSRVDATFIELDHKANVAHASPYYLKFDGNKISAGSNTSNVTAAKWSDIINKANGTWVSATSQEIVIDALYQTKFVVTSTIPGSLNANTYYII